jgi:hypothetical protein
VRQLWLGIMMVAILPLGVDACGDGGTTLTVAETHSLHQVASCLKRAGMATEIRDVDATLKMVGGGTSNGDLVFIAKLPSPGVSARATHAVRRGLHEAGLGAIITASTVNHGWTLVIVAGHTGANGGVAALGSELLARHCALESRGLNR